MSSRGKAIGDIIRQTSEKLGFHGEVNKEVADVLINP